MKPVPEELIQPFLYIEKVRNKIKPKKEQKVEVQAKPGVTGKAEDDKRKGKERRKML